MTLPEDLIARVQRNAAITGAVLLGISIGLAILTGAGAEQFFRSYLVAFMLCLGVALGSLAILMLHHLTGGRL